MHSKKEGKKCMKTTGITRRIDELGRIVIPKEIRKNMHIKSGELLEIFLNDSDTILLKKHNVINKNNEFIDNFINNFAQKAFNDIADLRVGLDTGNNEKFLRLWFEPSYQQLEFNATSSEQLHSIPEKKYVPHTKGG